jgi:Snf7
MGTLEQQINAIESANINRETLAAMEKAGEAMRQIHGKLTPQKVDETMCVSCLSHEDHLLFLAFAHQPSGLNVLLTTIFLTE